MVKRYSRRRRKNEDFPPNMEMKIVRKKSGAYEIRNFSMLKLRALEEYHSKVNFPRKWSLSKDETRLFLE